MSQETHDDGLDRFITDKRSGLAKLIGDSPIPHRVFAFAGSGGRFGEGTQFAVRALGGEGKMRALADAIAWLTTKGGWPRDALYEQNGAAVLDLESKVQVLTRVLVDPSDPSKSFVASADELRKLLEPDEICALWEQFLDFEDERSPLAKLRTWEEVEPELVAVGKRYARPTSLLRFDFGTRQFMLQCMAERLFSTPTKLPSSDTSPQSESTES